jgi:transposase
MRFINIVLEGMTLKSVASLFGVRFSTLFLCIKRKKLTIDKRLFVKA